MRIYGINSRFEIGIFRNPRFDFKWGRKVVEVGLIEANTNTNERERERGREIELLYIYIYIFREG